MTNSDLCENVFEFLKQINVEQVVLCAGARNAPLVVQMESQNFENFSYFEERSAGFFALGLAKQSGKPVAIMTTSGTAAAELLPVTIEAFYQGIPLILITADRPKSFRNTGAPQTIQQIGLFSHYVEQTLDWDVQSNITQVVTRLEMPIHLNVCFDEPLFDQAQRKSNLVVKKLPQSMKPPLSPYVLSVFKSPLVVVGEIKSSQKKEVVEFLLRLGAPVYLEALSQLRRNSRLANLAIQSSDKFVKDAFRDNWCDSVIRIGGIPTLRFWRDLESEFKSVPVLNISDLPFSGLSRKTIETGFCLNRLEIPSQGINPLIQPKDKNLQGQKLNLISEFPLSEPAFIKELSQVVGDDPLYLGNSLPIREWDMFADLKPCENQNIFANRGTNGIDGQVSTYLGWASQDRTSWCLVGDLTALYDLASLGLNSGSQRRVVIMNNFGGQIFNRVFKNERFINSHKIEFQKWAEMWSWDYLKITTPADFDRLATLNANTVIEIQPSLQQTNDFWEAWDKICQIH